MSWITKHRPRDFPDFIGHRVLIEKCQRWIADIATTPNLIFYGPPGTGKTSLAGLLVRRITAKSVDIPLFQNASKLAKMEIHEMMDWVKRLKIQRIGSRQTHILAVIDEADLLPTTTQELLASLLAGEPILPTAQNKGREIRFIFITNHIERIHASLRNLCENHHFTLKKREVNNIIRQFFGIKFKDPMCQLILEKTNQDLRRVSVLSDQNAFFGFDAFCEYIDDTEKTLLLEQIIAGEESLDAWWNRGQMANDLLGLLRSRFDDETMLYLERDLVKFGQTDGIYREVITRLKQVKINSGLINDNEHITSVNAPASA